VRDNLWLFLALSLIIALMVILFIVRDLKHTRQADRMKTDFVSNMSHEIRTPITAILGMNEMIQLESDDANVLRYADNIEKAGESLLGIINDILDFSKIEAGRMELNNQPYSLPELIIGLDTMFITRAQEKDLFFSMEIDEKLPVKPIGDMQKLRQVMTNILSNAVKYTKEGSVKLIVRLLSMDNDSFTMEVAVEDTGIGIKAEEMDKLYSAFDRLDLERTKNIEGSGLGLAITRKLLELMGSEIKVQSTYGEGSCFSFSIRQGISDKTPIGNFEKDYIKEERNLRKRAASFTASDARILIVDDTPMNLKVICGLLKGNQMNIDTAESGEKCISLFGDNDYDLVFLDQRMPVMDGVETLASLKKTYPEAAAKTPVICLTANVLSGGKDRMLKAGFTDYLTKPVTLNEMEQMLLKYLPADKVFKMQDTGDHEEETTSAIPGAIKAIEEIDISKGLEYCGDEEDYLDAIDIFASSAADKAMKLERCFETGDYETLQLLSHSLKSTSRAIGAAALSEAAASVEAQAKESNAESLKMSVPRLLEKYRALGEKLGKR
jgi:CheY-like chemotaxis protein/HPt (histidine-containing phosphotransfer) domain-containing protein